MPRLTAIGAPLALAAALVLLASPEPGRAKAEAGAHEAATPFEPWEGFSPLQNLLERLIALQVRIEQRVVVRISPQPMALRQELAAQAFERELTSRFEERRIGKCLPLESIAAVQTGSGNRLVLFLRDQRLISLGLEKGCRARDFYSGFYVERHKDGRLCVERDRLQSRTGATCEVERLRQLVDTKE